MELIDKATIITEIENIKEPLILNDRHDQGVWDGLYAIKKFIDTIEVKEVDLEKEIDNFIYTYNGRQRLALELDWKQYQVKFEGKKLMDFAKHFFELGLKAQRGNVRDHPWCCTVIEDFTGTVEFYDSNPGTRHVIGKGNKPFFSVQSGL